MNSFAYERAERIRTSRSDCIRTSRNDYSSRPRGGRFRSEDLKPIRMKECTRDESRWHLIKKNLKI